MTDNADKLAPLLAALPDLSSPELATLADAVESARQAVAEANRTAFVAKVRAMAADMGVPLTDLLSSLAPKATPRREVELKAKGTRGKAPVLYEGPNGETWSGRGRPASWLTALEAQGRKREEFLRKG